MAQYSFSAGEGYDNYGLILTGATLVPLQGFFNSLAYIRPRYAENIKQSISASVSSVGGRAKSSLNRMGSSMMSSHEPTKEMSNRVVVEGNGNSAGGRLNRMGSSVRSSVELTNETPHEIAVEGDGNTASACCP